MPAIFAPFVRTLLLTAQRRDEVADMRWEEIEGATWTIPAARRKKGDANTVPLTEVALQRLGKRQKKGFIFTTTSGMKPFSGFSKAKAALDEAIAELRKKEGRKPMLPWVLHDLRRTARSLMSRAGVSADIAERVLGHAIPGVRAVYDRHSFVDEKRVALERLATLVGQILDPPSGNVVVLRARH